ncbi:MAG: hypothetical protein ACM3JD_02740, partial [Rudaea sp.]
LLWTVEELFPPGAEQPAAEEPAAEQAREAPAPAPVPAVAASESEPPIEPLAEPVPAQPAAPAVEEGPPPPAPEPAPAQVPPAPSRRAPAIPTVAPTIPGALNKLPVWLLRFITRRPSDVIPLPPPAPAPGGNGSAVAGEPEVEEDEDEVLPDWLAAIQAGQTQAAAGEATHVRIAQRDAEAEADREDLPTWLRDEPVPAAGGTAPVGAYSAPAAGGRRRVPAPDWLDAAGYAAESVSSPETPASFSPAPGQQGRQTHEGATAWSAQSVPPPPASAVGSEAPELTAEEQAELPDWLRASPAAPGQAASAAATEEQPANRLVAPDPEAMLEQARQRAAEGRHAEALDLYEKIIHRGPRHLQAAVADLEALVQRPGAPSTSHRVLGDAYAMTGRFKEAIEQYRQVLNQ